MNIQRLRELSGFKKNEELIKLLKESKEEFNSWIDANINQIESNRRVDEGFFTSLGAAFKAIISAPGSVSKSVAKRVTDLGDSVKTLYKDEKAKDELKSMIDNFAAISLSFEKIEKESPTILKKDERIREVLKVFSDALTTIQYDLRARSIPPTKANESKKGLQFLKFLKENTNCDIEVLEDDLKDLMIKDLIEQSIEKKISWNNDSFEFTGKIVISKIIL